MTLAPLRAGLLIALFALTLFVRESADRLRPSPPATTFDVPPIPTDVARPLSFGFASVGADLAFLEAVQVHGGRKTNRSERSEAAADRALARLVRYAVEMDPKYRGAYRFAGMALIRHTTDGKAVNVLVAEQILQQGTRERPDDWQIFFNLGFIQSYYLGHMADAAESLWRASRLKGAPKYLGLLATRLAADAGDMRVARALAEEMVTRASEESTRAEWDARLRDIEMEERARFLDQAVSRFRELRGHDPDSLQDLVRAGILREIPTEPHGGRFLIEDGVVVSSEGGRLRVRGRKGTQAELEVR
ncbi:MAG: hypothetical protein E6J78_05005 [Deltaproteobacteria bacterium]|nr:MAG: hypothetical protein E6J78_05005 [Deltaproteobacteria bacterium]